ncbi:MAG: hypothetical protein ACJA2C_001329 [Marinoscillum sp.]|jgi:hypothetical protein
MDSYLEKSDLTGIASKGMNPSDSAKLIEKYVDDWTKKQLMISRALETVDLNEAEIERKVLDYRYALIVHSFEKKYINQHLNNVVSDEDIATYYSEKADNFLLRQTIVKCIFAKVPKDAPNVRQFRRNFREYPNSNTEDIKNYINQFANKSFLDDSTWIILDELILGTPLEQVENKNQLFSKNSYSETNDKEFIYFVKIFDYKISNEISPLEFIKDDIVNIIINKRKIALKKKLEDEVYEDAKQNKLFEVYR